MYKGQITNSRTKCKFNSTEGQISQPILVMLNGLTENALTKV